MASSQPQQQHSLLLNLPDELLGIILALVPLDAFLACQLTCNRLNDLSAESILWRRHCLTQYRYWKPERSLEHLSQAPPASVNWKSLLADRKRIDQVVARTLDSVLSAQPGRIPKVEEILRYGYDCKDALLKHLDVNDSAEDALARRYWSSEALGCLERAAALDVWSKLDAGEDVPLEHALGAFDLMIAERPPETLDQISRHLDDLAEQFKIDTPDHADMAYGVKARMLAAFLIGKRITSGNVSGYSEHEFRRLKNTLISVTLCDDEHPSIPIVSVAIFCSVARRVGLDAHPCAFPVRVLAIVLPPAAPEADAEAGDSTLEPLYLNVYDNVSVLPLAGLRQQLFAWGVPDPQHAEFLRPATTSQIVERNARNIQESLSVTHGHRDVVVKIASDDALRLLAPHKPDAEHDPTSLRTLLNPERAKYAISWYNIFSAGHRAHPNVLLVTLKQLGAVVCHDYRFDVSHFQRLALPFFATAGGPAQAEAFATVLHRMRVEEATPPTAQPRAHTAAPDPVVHTVGRVFQHRKYGYTAAITGWDPQCKADTDWIHTMQVDALPRGRQQCFYHVLVDDGTMRYVAEENIDAHGWRVDSGIARSSSASGGGGPGPGPDDEKEVDPPDGLLRLAGKFFKRWDGRAGRFVSNVRDQYPDD